MAVIIRTKERNAVAKDRLSCLCARDGEYTAKDRRVHRPISIPENLKNKNLGWGCV